MVRRRVWIPVATVVVLGALVAANLGNRGSRGKQVKTEKVTRRSLETWVRAPGRVQPVVSVDISSNVTGRVEHLAVREGDRVRRGQLLLTLDDTRLRSEVDQYEAMLSAAGSQLTLAEARRDLAAQVLKRREDLFEGGLLSSEELESARVDLRVNQAQVAAQRDEIARLRAAVRETRRNLEETRFLAAMDGVITTLNLEEGENVLIGTMNTPGTVILTLSDLSQMEVQARVNESDVVLVARGQEVRIEVDALPDTTLDGEVTSVGESGSRLSRDEGAEFEVHVMIQEPPGWLRPGMSADVEIMVAVADSALSIPIQALVARSEKTIRRWEERSAEGAEGRDEEGSSSSDADEKAEEAAEDRKGGKLITGVFVAEDGKARFRRVQTGVRGETFAEVRSGLQETEVIISGPYRVLRRLDDGEAVKPGKQKKEQP